MQGGLALCARFFQQFFPPSASQHCLVPAHTFLIFIITFSLFHFFLFTPAAIFELFCFHFSFSIRLTARFLSARRAFSAPPSRIPEWRTSLHLGSSVPSVASWRSKAIISSPLVGAVSRVSLCRQASVPSGRFFQFCSLFRIFSGCRAASAVKLRVPPTRSPASGGRERAGGGRGGWWRGWWFGTQALLSPGVMRPCRLASDGSSFSLVVGSPSRAGRCSRLQL